MSHSYSVLKALANVRIAHPVIRRLVHDISDLNNRENSVKLCWIPSHVGIHGNEKADEGAVVAAARTEEYIPTYFTDWYHIVRAKIMDKWNTQWKEKNQKMYAIKEEPGPWKRVKKATRKEEVGINRLRAGYANFFMNVL